jgi:hypothetical protein
MTYLDSHNIKARAGTPRKRYITILTAREKPPALKKQR